MILALLRVCWLSLKRDRVALLLTFVLPIVFFSIFAMIFGSQNNSGTSSVAVALVDLDNSPTSRRVVEAIEHEPSFDVRGERGGPRVLPSREAAQEMVATGKVPAAIVLLPGFGKQFGTFVGGEPIVDLLVDS